MLLYVYSPYAVTLPAEATSSDDGGKFLQSWHYSIEYAYFSGNHSLWLHKGWFWGLKDSMAEFLKHGLIVGQDPPWDPLSPIIQRIQSNYWIW
jgi:hypothetical protein